MTKEKNKTELPQVMEGELQTRLIKLREDAGYDTAQMASAMCLSEEVIINLENENFDLLAEPPYVRGYLRNYAKLGDEDPSELITRYESLRGADADELDFQVKTSTKIKAPSSKKRISPVLAQVVMLGVLIGGIAMLSTIPEVNTWVTEKWESLSSQLKPSDAASNPSLLGNLPVPAPLPEDEVAVATSEQISNNAVPKQTTQAATSTAAQDQNSSTQNTTAENTNATDTDSTANNVATTYSGTTTPANTEASTPEETQAAVNTQEEAATAVTTEETTAASSSEIINIKLAFDKEVWLRIKDKDNKTVFEGLNKADTEKTIELKKPLTFRVGNAQGLSLFIDNKAVDISTYINGSIANFTLE